MSLFLKDSLPTHCKESTMQTKQLAILTTTMKCTTNESVNTLGQSKSTYVITKIDLSF